MRDPTGIVQQSASPIVQYAGGKDYASKVNFNCMATSGAAMTQHIHAIIGLLAEPCATLVWISCECNRLWKHRAVFYIFKHSTLCSATRCLL